MAKGVNLTNTNIREFSFIVNNLDDDAYVKYSVEILDDYDNLVRVEIVEKLFTEFSNQIRASINTAMRLISQEENKDKVNENRSSWTDL